jgi:hypothetical protein
MLEPRNEGGAVLRERCRLQLPKRLHLPPGRAHACEGSSLFTSRGFVLKPTQWRELPKQNQVGSTVSGTVQYEVCASQSRISGSPRLPAGLPRGIIEREASGARARPSLGVLALAR